MVQEHNRNSMMGGLLHIKQLGFEPQTVFDVGAALGTFELYELFPTSTHFLIEPIVENEPYLAKICQKLQKADYMIAAATKAVGTAKLNVDPALIHSSASLGAATSSLRGNDVRQVPAVTLDQLCQERQFLPPYLIKIDVDGNEVDVLQGAIETLKQTEYVIAEVSFFGQIHHVINFMQSQGFVIYDILDLTCRPGDQALWQADMAFVKADGRFRQNLAYISEELQPNLDAHLKSYREAFIDHIERHYSDQPIQPNTLADEAVSPFKLGLFNWVACPDWQQPEEVIFDNIVGLLRVLLQHVNCSQITLLIDTTEVTDTVAERFMAAAVMHLMTTENFAIDAEPEIIMTGEMTATRWQPLIAHLSGRVILPQENPQALARLETAIAATQSPALPLIQSLTTAS